MNHIAKLKTENTALLAQVKALENALGGIRNYISSSKFWSEDGCLNGYVNVRDIDIRITESLNSGIDAHTDAYARAYALNTIRPDTQV